MTAAPHTYPGPPEVRVHPDRTAMGRAAATDVAAEMRRRLGRRRPCG